MNQPSSVREDPQSVSGVLTADNFNTAIDGEPRILDERLAEVLGFERPRKIRDLIRRYLDALSRLARVCPAVGQTSRKGGRPAQAFWLTKKQALFLCTKSETERATEITIQIVEVFDAVTSIAPVAPTTLPSLDGKGLALFRIGSRTVLVDTSRWQVTNEKAVVMMQDGRLRIERATFDHDGSSPWNGRRFGGVLGAGTSRAILSAPRPVALASGSSERSSIRSADRLSSRSDRG